MDDRELTQHLEQLHKTASDLSGNVKFLLDMEEHTLLILIQQAYLIERLLSAVLDGKPLDKRDVRKRMKEIRKHFDAHRRIMAGEKDV